MIMNMPGKMVIGAKLIKALIMNRFFGRRIPLIATILITNRCNLRCTYCYAKVSDRQMEDLSKTDIFLMIDALKKAGTVLIVLSGGEPLIRDDVGEIIDYVRKKNLMCEVLTNGYPVEKRIDDLKKVDSLCISIDGDEQTHDRGRGKGSYATAVRALEAALAHNISTRIHATITTNNISSLRYLINLAQTYGVRVNCAIAAKHTEDKSLNFNDKEIREFYKRLKEYKKKGCLILNAYSTLDYLANWPLSFSYVNNNGDETSGIKLIPCKRKDFTCYINTDGKLYPCATIWGKNGLSVLDKGVQEAWDNLLNLRCRACITEVEANELFNGSLTSLLNIFQYTITDRFTRKKKRK
jgi:MoaA/NifB/PqqE/SkfB family radical SAM enzyme